MNIVLGGYNLSAFVKDDPRIEIEVEDEDWELIRGADGEVTANEVNEGLNVMASVSFNLQYSGDDNLILTGIRDLMKQTKVPLPFLITDGQGLTVIESAAVLIKKMPSGSLGATGGALKWTVAGSMHIVWGGKYSQGV